MPLSRYERKERLPYGAQKEIAAACDVSESFVSRVNNDSVDGLDPEKVREVRVAIAQRLRPRISVAEAFPGSRAA